MKRVRHQAGPMPVAPLAFLAFAAAFMLGGGAAHAWGQVAFFLGAGLWLLASPPRWSPHWLINVGCVGLVVWSGLQLLPGTAGAASWRASLGWLELLERPSMAALSVHAQLTALVWIMTAIAWLYLAFEVNGRLERGQRRLALGAFASFIAAIGLVCFGFNGIGLRNPLASGSHVFTFLPNRNHMALLCAMGGVVGFALGFERILRHPWQGTFFLGCTAFSFLGLLSLTSRAAVFLFLLGLVGWSLASINRQSLPQRLKLLVPLGFVVLSLLLAVGQATSARILQLGSESVTSSGGMSRLAIYEDTFAMLPATFWTGAGWNSFQTIFPYYRDASMSSMAIVHPESDWLWLLAEGGMGAVLCIFLVVGGLGWTVVRSERHVERCRKMAALAVLLGLIHGFVDVPLHNAAVFLFLVWLTGLALAHRAPGTVRALWLPPMAWRAGGAALLCWGGIFAYGAATARPWFGSTVEKVSLSLLERPPGDEEAAYANDRWLAQALERHPFVWTLHTNQARAALRRGEGAEAGNAFARARAAQKDQGIVTWIEGHLWGARAPGRALDAYRSTFLERGIHDREAKFDKLLRTAPDAAFLAGLGRISRADAGLRERFFSRAKGPVVIQEIEFELRRDPRLERFAAEDRNRLWWRIGEHIGWLPLARHFRKHDDLVENHPLLAACLDAELSGWRAAGEKLVHLLPEPVMTDYGDELTTPQLAMRHRLAPEDLAVALALSRELAKAEEWQAIVDLTGSYRPPRGTAYPPSMQYWRARGLFETQRESEAGRWWRSYVRQFVGVE